MKQPKKPNESWWDLELAWLKKEHLAGRGAEFLRCKARMLIDVKAGFKAGWEQGSDAKEFELKQKHNKEILDLQIKLKKTWTEQWNKSLKLLNENWQKKHEKELKAKELAVLKEVLEDILLVYDVCNDDRIWTFGKKIEAKIKEIENGKD